MVESAFDQITRVQNFGVPPPKKFLGQKHAKFGAISNDFKLRPQMSPKRTKIFKIRQVRNLHRLILRSAKKFGELWCTNYEDVDV